MKKTRLIILLALALYVVTLAVAWTITSAYAKSRTEKVLEQAEVVFGDTYEDIVDSILLHSSTEIINAVGGTLSALPFEAMQKLSRVHQLDEINLVNRDGICVASSVKGIPGFNLNNYEETREFMELFKGRSYLSQPFRMGKEKCAKVRKYFAVAFPDGSGLVQLGYDYDRLVKYVALVDRTQLLEWAVGRSGHYDLYDKWLAENREDNVYVRAFTFAEQRFVAVLPESEYFAQRNLTFAIIAPILAIVIIFVAFFVVWEDILRARDLKLARMIQMSSLASPEKFGCDKLGDIRFDAKSRPAREVGGDFYDFYMVDESHLAVVMADVSGKGISAALFMMKAKNEIANAIKSGDELPKAVELANARLCENNTAEMFVTAWIGIIDLKTSELEYVNAGHNRPFLRRANGLVEKVVGKGGMILGLFPEAQYVSEKITIAKGELLYLYTDGVTEAMNSHKEVFGEMRLVETLETAGDRLPITPAEVIAAVEKAIDDFVKTAAQSDDITALVITLKVFSH